MHWPVAERSNRFLLCNVQDDTDFSCLRLNRDTWSDASLKRFVQEHFIFWQPSKSEEAGRYYTNFYPVDLYPHVGIVDPVTRSRMLVLTGFLEAKEMRMRLQEMDQASRH